MIILRHASLIERLLPQIMDANGYLRIGRLTAYMPANAVRYWRHTGKYVNNDNPGGYYVNNPAGEYPFHPCITGPGSISASHGDVPAEVFISYHHSPNVVHIPSLSRDSGGAVVTSRSTYVDGYFRPLALVEPNNPPLHDICNVGYNVDANDVTSQLNGKFVECNIERTFFSNIAILSRIRACAWYLLLVKGDVEIVSSKAARFDVKSWYRNDEQQMSGWYTTQAYIDALIEDIMAKDPNDASQGRYVLVKTGGMALELDIPSDTLFPRWMIGPQYFDAPQLRVNVGNGGRIDIMSWGFDIWPYDCM